MRRLIPVVLMVVIVGGAAFAVASEVASQGKVNLNTASAAELQLLPRIGPALASRIIEFREANGPFRSVDELVAVQGIGETSLRGMSPYLTVDGKTTLTEKVRQPQATQTNDEASS